MIGWLVDLLIKYSIDWLIDWLIDWFIDRLINWLIDCFIDWMTDCLIDQNNRLIGWLIDWLTGWLIDCSQLSNYDSFVTFKILLFVSKHIVTCFMSSISLTIAIIFIILQFQHMNDSNQWISFCNYEFLPEQAGWSAEMKKTRVRDYYNWASARPFFGPPTSPDI